MTNLREWLARRKRAKEVRRRVQSEARAQAMRKLCCGLCLEPLIQQELALGYCARCWRLRDENSAGVRPFGMPS